MPLWEEEQMMSACWRFPLNGELSPWAPIALDHSLFCREIAYVIPLAIIP